MKAARYHRFGTPDVMVIDEIKKAEIKDNQVLVKVHASSVNSGDVHLRAGDPFIARLFAGPITPRNKILGTTLSGEVVAVGQAVKKFKVGDAVMASLGIKSGSHAEYAVVDEQGTITIKPSSLNFIDAASVVFGGLSGLFFLRKGNIEEAKKILVIGASGGVGSYAVQIAKVFNAHVTGVCSTNGIDFVKSLGADRVIDYKKNDITKMNEQYDLVLDMVGKTPLKAIEAMLLPNGRYVTTQAKPSVMVKNLISGKEGKQYIFDIEKSKAEDIKFIADLVEKGAVKPLVNKVFPIDGIRDAHAYFEQHSKMGAIVLTMS